VRRSIRQLDAEVDASHRSLRRRVEQFARPLDAPSVSIVCPGEIDELYVSAGKKGRERDQSSRSRARSKRGRGTSVRGSSSSPTPDEDDDFPPSGWSLLGGVYGPSGHRSFALRSLFSLRSSPTSCSSAANCAGNSSLEACQEVTSRRDGTVSGPETIPRRDTRSPATSICSTFHAAFMIEYRNRTGATHVVLIY
jgi:hypothetical protein